MKLSEPKYVKLQTTQKCEFYYCLQDVVPFQKGTKPELCIILALKKITLCHISRLSSQFISHIILLSHRFRTGCFIKLSNYLRWKFQTYKSNLMLSDLIAK